MRDPARIDRMPIDAHALDNLSTILDEIADALEGEGEQRLDVLDLAGDLRDAAHDADRIVSRMMVAALAEGEGVSALAGSGERVFDLPGGHQGECDPQIPAFVVTAYRWGDRERHSYVLGAFPDLAVATAAAEAEEEYRGGKYRCEIVAARGLSGEAVRPVEVDSRIGSQRTECRDCGVAPHPAAQQLPAPTGEGTDVHAWLMARLDGNGLRPDTLEELCAVREVCRECGWDLREALEARHAFGVAKWGDTLRTRDGQDSQQAWGQERCDGLMYRAKQQMEEEGL